MTASVSNVVWRPTSKVIEAAAITRFARRARMTGGPAGGSYDDLWQWSVDEPEMFWSTIIDFCEVAWEQEPTSVKDSAHMPNTSWFPGGRMNYTAQVFRTRRNGVAVVGHDEEGISRSLTWSELESEVAALAQTLAAAGVGVGDTVVGYLPDCPEAIVGCLAAVSLGAVWSGCGTDLAADAAATRLSQLSPTAMIAGAGHHHRGSWIDRTGEVGELIRKLPSLRLTVLVGQGDRANEGGLDWHAAVSYVSGSSAAPQLSPLQVAADHPLWVLFTSGTTGAPKGIVHSHAGVVVEHLKTLTLHFDLRPADQFFWYTTLNWMMWNLRLGGLLCGSTVHCYDGAPTEDALWAVAERGQITHLGLSPGYLSATRASGVRPASRYKLDRLRLIGCTGSVLPASLHTWTAAEFGPDVLVGSTTGGTDVVTGFAGFSPTVAIRAGEIGLRCLGVDLHAWSGDGATLIDDVGELVVTAPMPSMPLYFWGDRDGSRYHRAYFDEFPGVWRHGDWITVTNTGSVVVHGRSDATLNRHGIRMGSADICDAAETLAAVDEALVVGIEEEDGGYWMPMFVTLVNGGRLGEDLAQKITDTVRQTVSVRHVPDDIILAPGIPHTRTGKKMEVPVKNVLRGAVDAIPSDSVDCPELFEFYRRVGEDRRQGLGVRKGASCP